MSNSYHGINSSASDRESTSSFSENGSFPYNNYNNNGSSSTTPLKNANGEEVAGGVTSSNPRDSTAALGFTRLSFAATGVKQDGFHSAAALARGNDKIVEVYQDVKQSVLSLNAAFICCGLVTYIAMIIFAAVTMKTFRDCTVYEPNEDRCCRCFQANHSRLLNQQIPHETAYNNVVYSILIIVNATFAFGYCVVAIKRENKYQIVCSLVAQFTSVIRAGADIFLETRDFAHDQQPIRITTVAVALVFVIISTIFTPKLFNKFGWVIFKRSAGNPKQREAYTLYQLYRSFNWLEIQSSCVLLAAIFGYLGLIQQLSWFPFSIVVVLEFISARQLVHHLKRNNLRLGVGISLVSKIFVLVYCVSIVTNYFFCRSKFHKSLDDSAKYWKYDPYPNLASVAATYDGGECLGIGIVHDDRAAESFVLNLSLLVIWRFSAVMNLVKIFKTTEGGGLKSLFYKKKKKNKSGKKRNRQNNGEISAPSFGNGNPMLETDTESESSLLTHEAGGSGGPNMSGLSQASSDKNKSFVPSTNVSTKSNRRGAAVAPPAPPPPPPPPQPSAQQQQQEYSSSGSDEDADIGW